MGEQESSNMFETLTMFVHVHALEVQFARTWSHVLRREPIGKGGVYGLEEVFAKLPMY